MFLAKALNHLKKNKDILNCNIIPKLNSYRETLADRMCPVTEGAPFSPTGQGQGQVTKGHYIQKSHSGHVIHVLCPISAI